MSSASFMWVTVIRYVCCERRRVAPGQATQPHKLHVNTLLFANEVNMSVCVCGF